MLKSGKERKNMKSFQEKWDETSSQWTKWLKEEDVEMNNESIEALWLEACKKGDIESLDKMKNQKQWKRWFGKDDGLGFLVACKNGQLKVVNYLLEDPALNYRNKNYVQAGWHAACEKGQMEVVRELLENPSWKEKTWSVNLHDQEEYAFQEACCKGQLEVVRYLLTSPELIKAGHTFADLHEESEWGLRLAVEKGRVDIVKYLTTSPEVLEAGHTWAKVTIASNACLKMALRDKNKEMLNFLLRDPELKKTGVKWDWNANHAELFRSMVRERQWEILKECIFEHGLRCNDSMNAFLERLNDEKENVLEWFRVQQEKESLTQVVGNEQSSNNGDEIKSGSTAKKRQKRL